MLLERTTGAGREFHTDMIRLEKKNLCVLVLASLHRDFERVTAQITIGIKSEEFIIDRDFIVEYIVGHIYREVSHQAPVL